MNRVLDPGRRVSAKGAGELRRTVWIQDGTVRRELDQQQEMAAKLDAIVDANLKDLGCAK